MGRRLIVFAGMLALALSPLFARDLVVSPDDGPYKTILEAIEASKEGDSIFVKPGKYLEAKTLAIPHSLRILGDGARAVQVFGPKGAAATFAILGARAVHLDGLGIEAPTTAGAAAVAVEGGSVTITHCVVRAGGRGIDLGAAPDGTPASVIVNCVLHGSTEDTIALRAAKCPAPLVRNTIFYQAKIALSLGEVGGKVEFNDFYHCSDVTKPPPENYLNLRPGFANADAWDYRLSPQQDSECFDKGHPAEAYKDALPDAGGTERCDLGVCGGAQYRLFPPYILARYTISATPMAGQAPLDVVFDVDFTETGDGDLRLTWVFGDGATSPEGSPVHAYEAGTWTAFLLVEQSVGISSASEALKIEVSPGPNRPPICAFEADPRSGTDFAPLSVRFAFTGDDPDLNLDSIAWEVDGEPLVFEGEDFGDGGAIVVLMPDVEPHEIRCTARDALGLSATETMTYFARPPAIIDLYPHPLPPQIRPGTDLDVIAEGKPGAYAVIFYGKEPLGGGEFDGTAVGLGSDYKVFGEVDEDGFPIPSLLDETGHVRIERRMFDLPGKYFFQVLVAADEKLEVDRMLSFVSADEKRFYVEILPAVCVGDAACFSGHLFLKKPVEVSFYDVDRETPGLQPKPGFETRPDGRYAIRFERVPLGHVEAQVVGFGGDAAVPITAPFHVRGDGFFEAPAMPDAPIVHEYFVRVFSRSRRCNVETGPLLFRGYTDFIPFDAAWEQCNLDSYASADPVSAPGWGLVGFVEWLDREAGEPLAAEIEAAETRIAQAEADYRRAREDLELAQRRLDAAFESAIASSMGALGIALSTLHDLLEDVARLGQCFTTCKWWEWLILVCPTRCVIAFTIDVINSMIDAVKTTIQTIQRCIQFLTTGIAFNNPDYFAENLVELEGIRDEAMARANEARAVHEEEQGRLDELLDRQAFLERFIAWVEGLPDGCDRDCPDLVHRMVAHRGGEVIPLFLEDERFFPLIRRPSRETSSAILWEHPGLPLGTSFEFGDIVIDPEGHRIAEEEYRKAFLFCNILERVERAFDFVFSNSPAYRAETYDDRDHWYHIVDVVYPCLAGPRSFSWGFDFDGNLIPDLALGPQDALDDTVLREYGRLVMDRMLRLSPLPVPGRADDYEKFPVGCVDENRSPDAAYVEGWSRFFVEAVSPAPGTIVRETPRNLQFLDAPCCPCRFREGYREESWIARIFWELYKEKPVPVLPGIDPGLYGFDDLAAAIPGPGVGAPTNICAYHAALTALHGDDPRVDEIYYRNLVAVSKDGRCGDIPSDRDHDGVPDSSDNCPFVANHGQEDADHDSIGDACDACSLPDSGENDRDYDGVDDRCEGPPVVSVTATPSSGAAPLEVLLSGSVVDVGGTVASWAWEVDGEAAGEGPTVTVTLGAVGDYEAVLRVVDDDGMAGMGSVTIRVGLDAPSVGDVNADLRVNIGDPIFLLSYLFSSGTPPACHPIADCADANADEKVNIGDAIYLLAYLFGGGPPPGKPNG